METRCLATTATVAIRITSALIKHDRKGGETEVLVSSELASYH
jgi:hypothetical protein